MRIALTDIGSNTVRMNVYDIYKDSFKQIVSEKASLGLLNYIDKGMMMPKGIEKLLKTLSDFKDCAASVGSERFVCFATASLRSILNSHEVMSRVYQELAIDIDLISGDEEALLDFYSVKYNLNANDGLIMDMGGGSTEFILAVEGIAQKVISEPFGSLSLYRKFVENIIPTKKEFRQINEYIEKKLSAIDWLSGTGNTSYLIGGSGRALGAIHRAYYKNSGSLNGYHLPGDEVEQLYKIFREGDMENIRLIIQEEPDRIHSFLPALCVFVKVMHISGITEYYISTQGVREGYLRQKILSEIQAGL